MNPKRELNRTEDATRRTLEWAAQEAVNAPMSAFDNETAEPDTPAPPSGWVLDDEGVSEVRTLKEETRLEPICGPLWVEGLTTQEGDGWGRLLAFRDYDGTTKRLAIPAARLHEEPGILARELATMGLAIIPGRERRLLAYIASWRPKARIPSAPRLGWMERKDGRLAFVFPDRVLTAQGHARVVYQPERYAPTPKTVHASGSLHDWQREIGERIGGSDALLFAACASLATPWLWLADSDSAIVHFWGTTSRGKTTLAQVAASVWGCGVDPAEAPSLSFIRRWNTTGNGLEGLAEAYSDLPLILDEIGSGQHRGLAPLIYQLAGGQGKTAMTASRELKAPRAWRTIAISTGEVSIEAKLSEDGRPAKGGLLHRALDIELSDIAAHLPEGERAPFVQTLKRACAEHYGTAGPAMLQAIALTYPTVSAARKAAREAIDKGTERLTLPHHAPEQQRAMRRFALIAWAGVFAARNNVLPPNITPDRVWEAVRNIAAAWAGTNSGTDADRIVEAVRAFILRHGARFQNVTTEIEVRDRAGFRDEGLGRWMFTKEALMEAAPGYDVRVIAKALKNAGHLFTNDNKLMAQVTTPLGRGRWYIVKQTILSGDEVAQPSKQGGQGGQTRAAASNPVHLSTWPKTGWTPENQHSDGHCPPVHPVHPENEDSQDMERF